MGWQKSVPLREWMESQAMVQKSEGDQGQVNSTKHKNEMIIRRVTIAYGISEILRHINSHQGNTEGVTGKDSHKINCCIDNFAVRISGKETITTQGAKPLVNIEGVNMLSPEISLQITEPSFLSGNSLGGIYQDQMGRYLEIEILDKLSSGGSAVANRNLDESAMLYSFGQALYELFSHMGTYQIEDHVKVGNAKRGRPDICQGSARKKGARKRLLSDETGAEQGEAFQSTTFKSASQYIPLQELGCPSSISLLVQNLLDCPLQAKDAYDTLHTSSSDLHLLLLEPDRFLFDLRCKPENNEKIPLQFRKEKCYGRETEVSQIQEAFCRVSSGQNEAFFIGGFSGSGKTRLVESLRAQVDVAGGYVIIQKFDAISKERQLLEVVSAFNDLCVLIKEKNSLRDLNAIAANLIEAFGSDISILSRLLPNLCLISPQLEKSSTYDYSDGDRTNFQSVCFILQRFMRVVSSKSHPLMLFFDDIHWCDSSALTVIEGILCDGMKGDGSCLFFVGSFRNNEVPYDHSIYRFMDNLDQCGVPSTKLNLFGINYNDLNTMISDAMGLFPRLCSNLSDIVFQKTKGNPFFVLEFLRSLVDGRLLQYNVSERRWVWDERAINSMDITDNVLFLLTNKMSQLPEKVQSTLKVVSCFGFGIHESVTDYLSATAQYSNIRDGLEELVWDSFMVTVAGDYRSPSRKSSSGRTWKFAHDKVREAAYSLIADEDKDKYHEDLGLLLHSILRGQKLGEAVLPIVDLINCGLQSVSQTPEMCIDTAKLNLEAGVKCFERSDYSTANTYLNNALSLLPVNHWLSQYNLSLQLYFLSAKSAYSCGNGEKACEAIQAILKEGCCIEDKVDAYFLLVNIFQAREESEKSYLICLEVLIELGENVSEYCDGKNIAKMVAETSKNLESITEEEMMAVEGDSVLQISSIMKFYSFIAIVAFFVKQEVCIPICCRMVELTLAHGVTKYSVMGLVQFSAALCQSNLSIDVQTACRIGKLAISLLNRFDSSDILPRAYLIYYGLIAHYTDPIQSCGDMLKKGFETGMSNGDTFSAFFAASQQIRLSLIGGTKLPSLLREIEYYLTIIGQHDNTLAKKYFLIYQQTIATLIDKGLSIKTGDGADELSRELSESLCDKRLSETTNFDKALQSFWLGHAERCHHYVLKFQEEMSNFGRHARLIINFYHGINTFTLLKRQRTSKLRQIPKEAVVALKAAAQHSKWNYGNKVHLLEAELSSYEGRHEDAESLYASAILASRSSRFVHEQGLACELAGFYYKKMGDLQRTRKLFNQAKLCYIEWGSEIKVDYITRQLGVLGDNSLEYGKELTEKTKLP